MITNNYQQFEERKKYPEANYVFYSDLNNISKIRSLLNYLQLQHFNIRSIVSFVDPFCGLAAKLAQEYNVGCFNSQAMYLMQNKLLSRDVLKETPYNPRYFVITQAETISDVEIEALLPVVLKYIESNGSKDVYFCKDLDSFKKYKNKLFETYPNVNLIVEEFLDGPQVIVEALTIDKKVNIVAIIEQEITYTNEHFIITGYNLVIDRDEKKYENIETSVNEIVSKFGLENGPCHLEMRLVNNSWKLVEINPRISGAGMNKLLYIGLGFNLVEETLKLSLKKTVNITPRFKKNTFAEYVIINQKGYLQRVTGKNKVMESQGVEYVYVKPKKGTLLAPPISLGSRYAYVIATGEDEDDARSNAKNAAAKIQFHILE